MAFMHYTALYGGGGHGVTLAETAGVWHSALPDPEVSTVRGGPRPVLVWELKMCQRWFAMCQPKQQSGFRFDT